MPNPNDYLSSNYTVVDFETTNKDSGDPRNANNDLLLSVYGRHDYERHWGGEYRQLPLVRRIEGSDFVVAHNAKFELGWLRRCGLDLHNVLVFDTMIAEYVLLGNRKAPLDLDSVAARYGLPAKNNLVKRLIKGKVCPSEIYKPYLERYCWMDVAITERVFKKQLELLKQRGLLNVFFTRCMLTPALSDIEMNGMFLDKGRVEDKYNEFTSKYASVERELNQLSGGGINWNSGPQVAEFVYGELGFEELNYRGKPIRNKPSKKFPDGAPKVDSDTLIALKAKTAKQKEFIKLKQEQSRLSKAISTYLSLFKKSCDDNGGLLQGSFNQCITGTHRLSSSKPNFQNFDRTFKPLFTARTEGWSVGEADYAQLEFRVAAFLGQDEQAIEDIKNGFDVHQYTADIINCARQQAKAHTFKPLFGGVSGTKAEKKYYDAFKEKYSAIADQQGKWVWDTLVSKKQRLVSGLILYHPQLKVTVSGYIEGNTKVRNYPIQSLATAEIVPIAVRKLWDLMEPLESFLVNTVHDSVIMEIHPDEKEKVEELVEYAFTVYVPKYLREVYGIEFNVELVADVEFKSHWGEK